MKKPTSYLLFHLTISLFVVVAYINSLGNELVSDDRLALLENPFIGKATYIKQSHHLFFFPLIQNTIFFVFGPNAMWFRILNIFAHLASANLIFLILATMISPLGAFLAALLFAVHPMLVEAVSWISGGPYSWYSAFFLVSFYWYILAKKKNGWYIPSVCAYIFSLSVGLPAVILSGILVVYEYCYGSLKQQWKVLSIYCFLSILYTFFALGGIDDRMSAFAPEQVTGQQYYNPLIQIPLAITGYITLFFWPQNLTLYHSEFNLGKGAYIYAICVSIALLLAVTISLKKNKFVFFSLSTFIISLLPMLTPFGFQWVYAERYGYFATIGLVSVAGYAISLLEKKHKTIMYLVTSIIVTSLTIRTIVRNTDWKNEDTLWTATALKSPSYYGSHNNMGGVYVRKGNHQKAVEEFQKAIELNPKHADAYYNLGVVYAQNGYKKQAVDYYLSTIKINPTYWKAQQNLAIVYAELGQIDAAELYMKQAQQHNPYSSVIQASLGILHAEQGKTEEARSDFLKALQLNPQEQLALQGLKGLP